MSNGFSVLPCGKTNLFKITLRLSFNFTSFAPLRFRLPENTEYYQNMRENLQKNIAAETGFSFNEDIENQEKIKS